MEGTGWAIKHLQFFGGTVRMQKKTGGKKSQDLCGTALHFMGFLGMFFGVQC
jgi:hypothetical protein